MVHSATFSGNVTEDFRGPGRFRGGLGGGFWSLLCLNFVCEFWHENLRENLSESLREFCLKENAFENDHKHLFLIHNLGL